MPEQAAPKPSTHVPGQPRSVLYVEDSPSNVRLVEVILAERPEITLLVATRGGDAVELAREHRPALVLLDNHLPDISGEEVLRRLRGDALTAEIPVVMVSGDATPENVTRLRLAGADNYLIKPFEIERFLAVIDQESEPASEQAAHQGATSNGAPPVLDPAGVRALHRLASKPRVGRRAVRELVQAFLSDAPERIRVIETAIETGDLGRVALEAHALRGGLASAGAKGIATLCGQLEAEAKTGDAEAAELTASGLDQALADARSALEREFGVGGPQDRSG
jgi:CheY-like chemotaxis protein